MAEQSKCRHSYPTGRFQQRTFLSELTKTGVTLQRDGDYTFKLDGDSGSENTEVKRSGRTIGHVNYFHSHPSHGIESFRSVRESSRHVFPSYWTSGQHLKSVHQPGTREGALDRHFLMNVCGQLGTRKGSIDGNSREARRLALPIRDGHVTSYRGGQPNFDKDLLSYEKFRRTIMYGNVACIKN
jgi:hypothetical protein